MITQNRRQISGQIAVAVVTSDGDRLRRLVRQLETDERLRVVACDGSEVEAVDGIASRTPQDDRAGSAVVVVDVPSGLGDDIELVRSISRGAGEAAIVVVGPDLDAALAALIAGASGVVARDASAAQLCDAVTSVAFGDAAVTPEVATCLVRRYQLLAED